jgi:hypothetical protein
MSRSVMGIVSSRDEAETILVDLQRIGFALPDLSIVCPVIANDTTLPDAVPGSAARGLLAGVGGLVLPGAEPLLAAGPLMAALRSAAAVAAVGGIAGALVGWGLPELQARLYQDCVAGGDILLAVQVRSRDAERDAETVLKRAGAHDVISARDKPLARAM